VASFLGHRVEADTETPNVLSVAVSDLLTLTVRTMQCSSA